MTHYTEHEEYQNRLRKRDELIACGVDPYPHHYEPRATAAHLHQKFNHADIGDSAAAEAGTTEWSSIAGRLVLFRAMGKNIFAHLQDSSGRLQVMFNAANTTLTGYTNDAPKATKILEKKLDLGDIVGVKGHLFHTQKGELTLYVKEATILCKTLLPLAEKHAGLHDKELRYRKRWLDLISNPDISDTFRLRSRILGIIRDFCSSQHFLEVETPILQSIYGGAEARPFVTELNALDQTMFMRISLEIPLKKLIVGGMERVFEIGKCFRNEGIDRTHNPEFTLLEAYAAFWDYHDMMTFVETLYETLATTLFGSTTFQVEHPESKEKVLLNVKAPWKRMTMRESIEQVGNIDVDALSDEEMRTILKESGQIDLTKLATLTRGLLIAALFEVFVEPKLVQPTHIIDHPIENHCPLQAAPPPYPARQRHHRTV